jgi:hypothetical protein
MKGKERSNLMEMKGKKEGKKLLGQIRMEGGN